MSRTRTKRAHSGAAITASASSLFDRVRESVSSRPWWQTALLVIGFVTVITAVSVLFLGVNSAPREIITSDQVAAVNSEDFTVALSRLVGAPVEQGGTVEILNNGDEFLPALLQSINEAKNTINFSV